MTKLPMNSVTALKINVYFIKNHQLYAHLKNSSICEHESYFFPTHRQCTVHAKFLNLSNALGTPVFSQCLSYTD